MCADLGMGWQIQYTEGRKVPHGRIRIIEVGLDPDCYLPFLKGMVEHLIPELEVFFHSLIPARACSLCLFEFPEPIIITGADVRTSPFDQLRAEIIVPVSYTHLRAHETDS